MELSGRDRRVLAELENQFTVEESRRLDRALSDRRPHRPQWTVLPSAILGFLLLAASIVLTLPSAALLSLCMLSWWAAPWIPRLLRAVGRYLQ
jgi:Protein of unknown function (DUF3040)